MRLENVHKIGGKYCLMVDGQILWRDKSLERITLIQNIYNQYGTKALQILKTGTSREQKRKVQQLPRNIYRNKHGNYVIQKQIHGKKKYYGSYHSLKEAIQVKNQLEEEGWKRPIKSDTSRRGLPRYVYRLNKGYILIKDNESYGVFKNLEDALAEKALLIDHNWDYDYIDLV